MALLLGSVWFCGRESSHWRCGKTFKLVELIWIVWCFLLFGAKVLVAGRHWDLLGGLTCLFGTIRWLIYMAKLKLCFSFWETILTLCEKRILTLRSGLRMKATTCTFSVDSIDWFQLRRKVLLWWYRNLWANIINVRKLGEEWYQWIDSISVFIFITKVRMRSRQTITWFCCVLLIHAG